MSDASSDAGQRSRVTIQDVAKACGVSATTVSHVLTGKRPVAAATKERVQATVARLNYRPNHVARNLRTRSSQMVAVVIPDITNPFYSLVTRGLSDALGLPYGTYTCSTDGSAEREQSFVFDALARGVDALVVSSVDPDAGYAATPTQYGTPVVCVGDSVDHPQVDRVIAADGDGSRAAVEHLIGRGARRVGMIEGPAGTGTARIAGYHQALEAGGLRASRQLSVQGDWTRAGGHAAMTKLMRRKHPPDAVFCANDLMAIGAMDAARELQVRIPDDVALVGFDDIEAAALVSPGLSTVANPAYEAGRAAGGLLLDRLLGRHTGGRRTVVLPCRLVVRATS